MSRSPNPAEFDKASAVAKQLSSGSEDIGIIAEDFLEQYGDALLQDLPLEDLMAIAASTGDVM